MNKVVNTLQTLSLRKRLIAGVSIPDKLNSFSVYTGWIFNILLAGQFLQLWVYPFPGQVEKIYGLSLLIIFEFVMVHSGIFMALFPPKISLLIFFPFYGLFAIVFSLIAGNLTIIVLYLIVVFNRMRFAFFDVGDEARGNMILQSILSLLLYFALIILVAISSNIIPAFGLNENFLSLAEYEEVKKGATGIMVDSPQTSMCLGVLYYIILTFIDYKLFNKESKAELKAPFNIISRMNKQHLKMKD